MFKFRRTCPIIGFLFLLVHHFCLAESHHNMTDKERYDLKYVAASVEVYAVTLYFALKFTGRRRGTCSIMHIERTWRTPGQPTN